MFVGSLWTRPAWTLHLKEEVPVQERLNRTLTRLIYAASRMQTLPLKRIIQVRWGARCEMSLPFAAMAHFSRDLIRLL